MKSLKEKLKSLGVELGVNHLENKPDIISYPIERVLDCEFMQTMHGEVFIHEENLPKSYVHGNIGLFTQKNPRTIFEYAKINNAPLDLSQVAFLDTETTGLSGGTGAFIFLIGLGFFTREGFSVKQIFLRDPSEESSFLAALDYLLAPFSVITTYNGKAFDSPLINTRFNLQGVASPLARFLHIDLLPLARRLWKYRLESRSLKVIEKDILQFDRTEEEIPGWEIPQIYIDYLHSRDARPLKGVFYHNASDIISLAALFNFFTSLFNDPTRDDLPSALDTIALGHVYEQLGKQENAIKLYASGISQGLPSEFYFQTINKYASIYKRNKEWEKAIPIWEEAARHHHLDSMIELAKFYEHQDRNLKKSKGYIEKAIELLNEDTSSEKHYGYDLVDLHYRLARVIKKLSSK